MLPPYFYSCMLLSFLPLLFGSLPLSSAQTYNMTRGMNLSSSGPNSYLLSPSCNFAFGFRAYNSDESLFLLAIWFNTTSPQHIIWFLMNGDKPMLAPVNSTLILNQDGYLTLTRSDRTQLWSTNTNDADHAAILNSGNFVVCKIICDDHSIPLWQSFQYPTDTIVPGQVLPSGQALWSKLTDLDFSRGRFTLAVQSNNDLVLWPVSLPTRDRYHALWLASTNQNCANLVFNPNGSLYCQLNDTKVYVIQYAALSTLYYYQHATVDPDGLFRIYVYAKNNSAAVWEVIGQNYPDGCLAWNENNTLGGGGICGVNGYCSLNSTNQTRVNCQCPPHYSVVDPDNIYEGCKPDLDVQQCNSTHETTEFEFTQLLNTDWRSEDYEWYQTFSEGQCTNSCLADCSCAVAIYKSNGCHKKSLPLQLGTSGPGVDGKVFIKVPKSNDKKKRLHMSSVILIVATSTLFVIVALFIVYLRHAIKKSAAVLSMSSRLNLREFTYKELECSTKNFNNMLGRGKFGVVFKGVLPSEPPIAIAVKKLDISNHGEREFESEVHSIGRTHHKHLVKLIGFCTEGSNFMLVYDYMSNGSLENFTKVCGERLSWDIRAKVALGIAKGLQYLHEDCDPPVIHCDIKPQNILLDDKFVAKIADFGVAKLLGVDQTHITTYNARGTFGYMAPEWTQGEQITLKVDVYSFGVLLLEIIFCMANIAQQAIRYLRIGTVSQAVEQLMEQLAQSMGDAEDKANIKSMKIFVEVAVTCLQADPNDRPTMRDVAYLLAHAIPASANKTLTPVPANTIPEPSDNTPLGSAYDAISTPEKPMLYA